MQLLVYLLFIKKEKTKTKTQNNLNQQQKLKINPTKQTHRQTSTRFFSHQKHMNSFRAHFSLLNLLNPVLTLPSFLLFSSHLFCFFGVFALFVFRPLPTLVSVPSELRSPLGSGFPLFYSFAQSRK